MDWAVELIESVSQYPLEINNNYFIFQFLELRMLQRRLKGLFLCNFGFIIYCSVYDLILDSRF